MDRINIKCLIAGQEVELQLDRKTMPGETGPCFMITEGGCFKGYISQKKNGAFYPIGASNYADNDLKVLWEYVSHQLSL